MDAAENRTGTDDTTTPETGGTPGPYAGALDPDALYSDAPYSYSEAPTATAVRTVEPPARERRRFTLRRSRSDAMLGGVCGGLADELDVDPALVRIATIALTLFTGGGLALVYLAAWILAPREDLAVV